MQATQANTLANENASDQNAIGISLSYGSQSSTSTQTSTQNQSQGSTLTAGNNLNLHATGTDLNVQGSQLQAGKDVGLSAARDVNLFSGLNSQTLEGKNESHGASVGVGINFGQGANGLSLNASVNKGKGSETGNGTSHVETTVNAGNHLTISSGRDTALTGAQVNGEKVTLDVGRNLTLTSEQDTDNYDSKQQNASAGGSVSMSGGSGSVNLSRDKMHSTYESVQEQTGIFAGKGGFDITVGEHTQLNGAVIGSTADASLNKLDTGTLGFSNIKNSAEYEVEHQSVGVSSGGNIGDQFAGNMASSLLVGVNGSDSDSSTTKSAVSEGSIIIRDADQQTQNVDQLSRDVEHANQTLSPIFDKEKEQNRLKEAQLIGEIGSQAMDIARTQGKIEATKAANEKMKNVTPEQLQAAKEAWLKANPGKEPKTEDITNQAYQNFYNQAFTDSGFGTGGKVQQALQAATAAVQGLAGGDIKAALAGGTSPYLAEVIKKVAPDEESRVMAHIVLGAISAELQGGNALAGASGAGISAAGAEYIRTQLYGDRSVEQLKEQEKQTVTALATLAGGLAGGIVGGDISSAMDGGKAAQNEANFNWADNPSTDQQVRVLSEQYGNAINGCNAGDPSACRQKDKLEKSYTFLVATAGTSMMGGAASTTAKVISTGLSGAANATSQLLSDDPFSYQSFIFAGVSGWKSAGANLLPTVGISAGTAYMDSALDGKDPTGSVTGAVAGSAFGYGLGKAFEIPLDKVLNPISRNYESISHPLYPWITTGKPPSSVPGIIGGITGSAGSEGTTDYISEQFKKNEASK